MMSFIPPVVVTFFHFLTGWFGLGVGVSIVTGAAYFFLPEIPIITTKVRQLLLMTCIVSGAGTVIYTAGYTHGRADLKTQVQTEATNAISSNGAARTDALDALHAGRVPDSWFRD